MSMEKVKDKNFNKVFQKIKFSDKARKSFSDAEVEKIHINKADFTMNVEVLSYKIIHESLVKEISDKLYQEFPLMSKINVNLRYINLEDKIKNYWENILYAINEISPLCYKIAENAEYTITTNHLEVALPTKGLFIFSKKQIDKAIQKLINDRFLVNFSVRFTEKIFDEEESQKHLEKKQEFENKLYQDYINEVVLNEDKAEESSTETHKAPQKRRRSKLKINHEMSGIITKLNETIEVSDDIFIEGQIFQTTTKETKNGLYIVTFDMTDGTNSITVKFFLKPDEYSEEAKSLIKKGSFISVYGKVQFDEFSKEIVVMANEIGKGKSDTKEKRIDNAEVKRVELHLHTQMSAMDAVTSTKAYIERALEWGHKAIAITDHGVLQAFPEAMTASAGKDIKIIYGVECYLINDMGAVVQSARGQTLDGEFVVFDVETTGFSKEIDVCIEIGAVKVKNGVIVDKFSSFINQNVPIPKKITSLTGITDEMLVGKPLEKDVIPKFYEFIGNAVLVAHNSSFDVGFLKSAVRRVLPDKEVENTVLDTVELSRTLFTELKSHKLNLVANHLGVKLDNHHRAVDDAIATAEIFLKCTEILKNQGINSLQDINILASKNINKSKLRANHAVILVKNQIGLRNLYELVSKSHIEYYHRRPRIPKSEYLKFKEGLIIGTACESGEFYRAILDNKPKDYFAELAEFYDYFEIQPIENTAFLVREKTVASNQELMDINKKIVELGKEFGKPVVATCDVHFLEPEDELYRRVIMAGGGFSDADNQAPLYFRTTEEMLEEFSFLGEETAKEVVITNTNKIADLIEKIKPIPDGTFPPKIEGSDEELREITTRRAKEFFGEPLPKLVEDRLNRELDSIIKNGFAVMYIIAQKLVKKSLDDGYLVGSRGSVGSSFVATMAEITEVNPLPAHYLCKTCKFSDFDSEDVLAFKKENPGGSGCDMLNKNCPVCESLLERDGHDIPFETFLGFDGDKEPDIDLNFSGEYQAKAHAYAEELFGSDHVFKAGTIGTLADKTAFGYVKKYMDERGINSRKAEIERIKNGCTGIKKTTGQHPGGLMVVPAENSIYEFCPIQRPANDMKTSVVTTHFDYNAISGRLLKLDILGHDVPTIIRMLHDFTGINPQDVSLSDKRVMSLFTSPEAMLVNEFDIDCKTGSLGLPEFGTGFVRQMLIDTNPQTFGELVRISGLSHGTDVWLNNAQELIKNKTCTLKDVIPTRDDIMVYLIASGLPRDESFKIMENVRKGKGLTAEEEKIMEEYNIPAWYISSCKKIKYMFPKGHAVAYVMMTVRIAYFKLHHPYSFYAATFSVKSEDFDYELMCKGKDIVKDEITRIKSLGNDVTAKDKSILTTLELVNEMYARKLNFAPLNLYEADATKFKIVDAGIMPPLSSIQGLGETVAQNIVDARLDGGEFFTVEEFRQRTKVTKGVLELLKNNGVLDGIPETDQLTLF